MANRRNSVLKKCLFCKRQQPSTADAPECNVEINGKPMQRAFWVCDRCGVSENDPRGVHSIVLTETESISCDGRTKKEAVIQVVTGAIGLDDHKSAESDAAACCCQACMERKQFEQDQFRQVQTLHKCWLQLRHAVRQMYRDRLLRDGVTGKGKKFDLAHLSELVEKICHRDPYQLYQRLESIGREHVMELKVSLLQILVSQEKAGASCSDTGSIASDMSFDTAEHFLRSLLNSASQLFETVDNMKLFLAPLEKEQLEKFGITWRIVNCNLFDAVIYHDPLLQSTLPSIYSRLGFKVALDEGSGEGDVAVIVDRRSTPSHIADMMKNFMELGSTLAVCRERMDLANRRMEEYISKQMKIYKATLKAKQKVLKQDLEFFKRQRKLLEEYVMQKKSFKRSNSGDEDVSAFAETLRCLISRRNNAGDCEHAATASECIRCHRSHCPCDQCSISHLIACGLSSDCADCEISESIQFLDDLNDSSDYSSSSTDSEDSDFGADEREKGKKSNDDRVKRTNSLGGDEYNVLKIEATILPKGLFSTVSNDDSPAASVQRHMYNAYGDWDVNVDPSTLLFSSHWEEILLSTYARTKLASVLKTGDSDKCASAADCDECTVMTSEADEERKSRTVGQNNTQDGDRVTHEKPAAECKLTPTKARPCRRHHRSYSGARKTKRSSLGSAAAARDGSETKPGSQTSPRKAPDRVSKTTNVPPQQFTQEWLKDPKNAKYVKGLLACAVADATCLKELNLDVETVKKLYAQYAEPSPDKGLDQAEDNCHANGDTQQRAATVTEQLYDAGDPVSADEEDDSWSDHSSVMSQKDNKHCDCCYCEMFGHGGADIQKSCGRYEYPQIRERLRLKLKKKESELPSKKSENVDGYRGYESLDALLEYINGSPQSANSSNTTSSVGAKSTPASGKKSKKVQAKVKKMGENRKAEKRDHNHSSCQASPAEHDKHEAANGDEVVQQRGHGQARLGESRDALSPKTERDGGKGCSARSEAAAESHCTAKQDSLAPKKSRRHSGEEEDVNIDEVFKPKDIDLNSTELDEAEREVESFKRFVMDCQPRENRAKVHLNISHLLRDKKGTAAAAV